MKEIEIKKKQKVKKIFLSSIFRKKNYLGIYRFKILTRKYNDNFVALGGIKNTNYKKLNLIGIKEFAGISFFKKKGPYKRGL